jgi:hypothetical protein
MNGSPTASRAHVQRTSSVLYRQKQLRQAGAVAAKGGGSGEKTFIAMKSKNDRLRSEASDTEADTSRSMQGCRFTVFKSDFDSLQENLTADS